MNAPKKLDTSYNPETTNMHKSLIEDNYKVTEDTRVNPIVEHRDDEIQWACSTFIYTDAGYHETLQEAMTSPNEHLWKISAIYEANTFLSRKAWIQTKRISVEDK